MHSVALYDNTLLFTDYTTTLDRCRALLDHNQQIQEVARSRVIRLSKRYILMYEDGGSLAPFIKGIPNDIKMRPPQLSRQQGRHGYLWRANIPGGRDCCEKRYIYVPLLHLCLFPKDVGEGRDGGPQQAFSSREPLRKRQQKESERKK